MYITVDNGGTFTDFWAFDERRSFRVKTRTTPHDLSECLFEGLRLLSEEIYRTADLTRLLRETRNIRYSTTQGTNALVQRKGPRVGIVLADAGVARAMRGDGEAASMLEALVGDRVEVMDPSGLTAPGDEAAADAVMQAVNRLTAQGANRIVVSLGSRAAERAFARHAGRRFPQHLLGTVPILMASDVTGDAERARATWTAVLNAFLHPAMERFLYNTDNRLKALKFHSPLLVFRNDGLAGRVAKTSAIKTYGSGPEGGVRGAEALARRYGFAHLVTLDVGGTTTDIGIVEDGASPRHRFGRLEAVEVSIPMSEMRSVGVGGGSVIRMAADGIRVGPDSVGAAPGPACFGFGGTAATITDVKLMKGVIDPGRYFGGRMQLDAARARAAVEANIAAPMGIDAERAADAMEAAWVEAVARHLRAAVRPGSVLGAFGGAGPFCICAIADAVGVKQVIVPAMAAVFSASGIGESDIGHRYEAAVTAGDAAAHVEELTRRARADMFAEGFDLDKCVRSWTLIDPAGKTHDLDPADAAGRIAAPGGDGAFLVGLTVSHPIGHNAQGVAGAAGRGPAKASGTRRVRLPGAAEIDAPVYLMEDLAPGMAGQGPAIIEDPYFTLPLPAGWRFAVTPQSDVLLSRV